MKVGGAGQVDARDRQLDGELRAVPVHPGQLEPAVEDHRRARSRGSAPGRAGASARSDGGTISSAISRPIASSARVAEGRLGRLVPADHAAAVIHRHDRVERRLEHRPQPRLARAHLRLGMAARDELADLAAEHAHRVEQPLVRLAQLAREELHHADDPARAPQREAERGVQARAARGVGAREVRRPRARPRSRPARRRRARGPGRPSPGSSVDPLAERLELGRALAGVPGADAAQPPVVGLGLPDGAELPAERAADRLERRGVDLDRALGFREDPRDLVLDALQVARVGGRAPARRKSPMSRRRYTPRATRRKTPRARCGSSSPTTTRCSARASLAARGRGPRGRRPRAATPTTCC